VLKINEEFIHIFNHLKSFLIEFTGVMIIFMIKEDLTSKWQNVKLIEVLESLENGNRPKGGIKDIKKGIPSLGGEHLNSLGGFKFDKLRLVTKEFYDSLRRGKIKKFDVLLVKDGATTGKSSFVNENFPFNEAAVNEHVFILRGKKGILNQKFLFYHLYSPIGQKYIQANFHGAAIGGINTQFVKNYKIFLPPLEIQEKIVKILENVENLKELRRKADKLADKYIMSVFLEMFGDPYKNPKGWETRKLGDLSTKITDGVHSKPKYTENGVPFISVVNISSQYLKFDNCKFISNEAHEKYVKRCNPEFDDILYTKVGATYGIASIVDTNQEFSLYVSVALIKPKHELINSIFLKTLMNSQWIKRQADGSIKGIGVPDLHLIEIKKFNIILPPMELQEKFAKIVKQQEKLKCNQLQTKQEIDNLFNILMQKAFKGELIC